jgi:hypothetical protein
MIEDLFSKRRQIRAAWDNKKVPSKDMVYDLLSRTLNISASKQNLFPFKIHAFGPEDKKERDIVSKICALFNTGSVNNWEEEDETAKLKNENNKDAPWVLVFELRKCEPNTFVKEHSEQHNDWKRFTQIDERFRGSSNTTLACIEVGMFVKLLAALCLENELQISYINSFPAWVWDQSQQTYKKDKNKVGLDWNSLPQITEIPLLVVQIGYKADMRDPLATNAFDKNAPLLEDKPHINEILQFSIFETR